ncbi:hypothetical protein D3C73_1353300 [compost metagenome]
MPSIQLIKPPVDNSELKILSKNANEISLGWQYDITAGGTLSFNVYQDRQLIQTLKGLSIVQIKGLQPMNTYIFEIEACNEAGCSPLSSIEVTTPAMLQLERLYLQHSVTKQV